MFGRPGPPSCIALQFSFLLQFFGLSLGLLLGLSLGLLRRLLILLLALSFFFGRLVARGPGKSEPTSLADDGRIRTVDS